MIEDQRTALAALRFNWAPVADDVWRPAPFHLEGLHRNASQAILQGLDDSRRSADSSPIGLVLQGQRGAGKTHLLGWVRERVHAQNGYFFLVSLLDAKGFWGSVVQSLDEGLARSAGGRDSQLRTLLRDLGTKVRAPRTVRRAVSGETTLTRRSLDTFVELLCEYDGLVGRECQETARALALLASGSATLREAGETFLQSADDDHDARVDWGLRHAPRPPELIVRDLSWLLALSGPTVIAVDQIDTLIAQSIQGLRGDGQDRGAPDAMLERIAGGLMSLRERTRRTLTLVACIPDTWALIRLRATDTVQDRFREATQLKTIPTAEVGRRLIEKRFAFHFGEVGYTPPYETWPVRASAFDDAPGFTPRQLLITIDQHVQACILDDEVREMDRLGPAPVVEPTPPPLVPGDADESELVRLDARFAELKAAVDPAGPLTPETEDVAMPELLSAGLTAGILARGEAGRAYTIDPDPGPKPALHARLRRTLDERTEDQVHWGFRAISASNYIQALNRLRRASTAAGITDGIPKRKLFILRPPTVEWARGPQTQTQAALRALRTSGGKDITVHAEDIRILGALQALLAESPPNLHPWLVSRKPASRVVIFREAFGGTEDGHGQAAGPDDRGPDDRGPGPARPRGGPPRRDPPTPIAGGSARSDQQAHLPVAGRPDRIGDHDRADALALGVTLDNGTAVRVELEALRKHTAIFAGSGSGKTVLIRRLVEECALRDVSAIVLDPNNDLARLGDPWPQPPAAWENDDARRAAEYLDHTDVVVWTPRREAGRPLSFQPLPDFRSVVDDADEFSEAVEAAVASIVPRAKLDGRAAKAHLGQAVLRSALQHYGRRGAVGLRGLIDLLAALPPGVSELDNAEKIAADLAQTLTAAMINDPLFGGEGTPVDPGLLLTPPPGKRSRISVISFVGLPSDEQRQSFVNQLQMALFAWIKKHPAGDRPLGGLFVMDEAQTLAPSGAITACTQSTLALASQARKYGLGLVFATQAPKGLHNRIPGNAASQFFGLLNSPVQIAAAREMAAAKGGDVPDISLLRSGQFYVAVEGATFTKIRTPLCLSYHPKAPLTTEEVIERARQGR
jgi:Helicase HerA, central domain